MARERPDAVRSLLLRFLLTDQVVDIGRKKKAVAAIINQAVAESMGTTLVVDGGQHLMRASAPDAFANIAAGDRIVTANRQALEACRKRADKAREAVRCTIKIEPEARR